MLKDLVKSCRSYRRFYEDISIPQEELTDMVDTVRLTGCTANCQPLNTASSVLRRNARQFSPAFCGQAP